MIRKAFAGPTIAARMIEHDSRSRGFDYLRIGLSLSVFFWHCFFVCYQNDATHTPFRVVVLLILPMFFALSGFLVSGSLLRTTSVHEFLTLRAVRIIPALAVEVTLSALLIGMSFTNLPLSAYLSSPQFQRYFLNIVGDIHFYLPGVFLGNPYPVVNGSLWTIPYELYCYIAITLLWISGAVRNRRLLLLIVVLIQVFLPIIDLWRGMIWHPEGNLSGRLLILSFLCGVVLYFYREYIVLRTWMFGVAVVSALLLLTSVYTAYLIPLPAAYITVFLGLTNPRKMPIVLGGDYSYGIYLYSVPIQQAVVALFPAYRVWWFVLVVAIVPVCSFAAFSWHVIERPILVRRKRFVGAADWLAGRIKAGVRPATAR